MMDDRVLHIVVIGAGLGGLATAISLARHGHMVHVYEAGTNLSELGAGIQVPPNATRILDRWGLREALERRATEPNSDCLRRYSDGSVKARLRRRTKEHYGYENLVIHRADLQDLLHQAASEQGVGFTFGRKVTFDEVSKAGASEDPKIAKADLIVASDGISSVIRSGLFGYEATKPALTGDTASRVILDSQVLRSDPKLAHLVADPTLTVWMGPRRHVVAYTIRDLELFNVVLCGPGEAPIGKYNYPYDPKALVEEYSDFDEVVRGILSKPDKAHRWTISETPQLPSWSSTDGRLVLLGDAAHAMMPYAAQGAAQCVEDAAVLGVCLSRARPGRSLTDLLRLYETLRKPRAHRVQEVARGNRFLFGLEDGPQQEQRDERLARSLGLDAEGESPKATKSKPQPNSQAAYGSPEFGEWLFGLDVEAEAVAALEKLDATVKL